MCRASRSLQFRSVGQSRDHRPEPFALGRVRMEGARKSALAFRREAEDGNACVGLRRLAGDQSGVRADVAG